eukprot:365856-Chlamydomonas_euryale.AAC.11
MCAPPTSTSAAHWRLCVALLGARTCGGAGMQVLPPDIVRGDRPPHLSTRCPLVTSGPAVARTARGRGQVLAKALQPQRAQPAGLRAREARDTLRPPPDAYWIAIN